MNIYRFQFNIKTGEVIKENISYDTYRGQVGIAYINDEIIFAESLISMDEARRLVYEKYAELNYGV